MLLYHGSQFIIEKPEFGKGKRIMTTGRVFTVPRMQGLPENGLLISDGYGYESVFEEWPFYESDFVRGDETR